MNNLSFYLARIYYALTQQQVNVIPSGQSDAWWSERIYRRLAGFPDRMSGGKNASFWLELTFYNKTNQAYRQATGTMPAWFWLSKLYAYYAGNATDSILQPASAAFWADKLASIPNLGLPEIGLSINSSPVQTPDDNGVFTPSNPVQGTTVQYTVTATNGGTANLILANATRSGAVTAVSAWSSTTLIPGASATCTITLNTASLGAQTGYFEFITNDLTGGEDVYRVNVSYAVTVQNIKVTLGVTQVTDGGSYAAGDYNEDATAQVTCTVENIGDALLTIQNPTIDGHIVSASAFSDLTLTPTQSVTSTVTLNTATSILTVARSGNIHIASDDPDTPSFDVQINFNANPVWLLNDDFLTNASAPLTSPRTTEPGGQLVTLVQDGSQFSISNQNLQIPLQSPAVVDANRYYSPTNRTRAEGLALIVKVKQPISGQGVMLGWSSSSTGNLLNNLGVRLLAVNFETGALFAWNTSGGINLGNRDNNVYYALALVLSATGGHILIMGGAFTNWTLLWRSTHNSTATVYAALSNLTQAVEIDNFRVRQLANEWLSANPIATTVLSGARSVNDTFTHEANAFVEWIQTTLPTALNTLMDCWQQDAANKWEISVSNVGTISLTEIVAAVPTVRGTALTVVANGHRILVKRNTTTIIVYSGAPGSEVLRITYSSASNFQSATSGVLAALGTGGAVANIIANPVAIPANALAELVKGL